MYEENVHRSSNKKDRGENRLPQRMLLTMFGQTALMIGIKNNHSEAVKLMLNNGYRHGLDIDLKDKTGASVLHLAVQENNVDVVGVLLTKNASYTLQDALGRTALFLAVEKNHRTVIEKLLEPPNPPIWELDQERRTPLYVAADLGSSKIVEMLLGKSTSQGMRDEDKQPALNIATANGHTEVINLLS